MSADAHDLRFEARNLKSYAEPISKSDLKEGEVYFALQFADEDLLIPIMHPYVFVGTDLDEGDKDLFYFQDFEFYSAGVRWPPTSEEDRMAFHVYGPTEGKHLFDFERALDRLLVCSLRRKEYGGGDTKAPTDSSA